MKYRGYASYGRGLSIIWSGSMRHMKRGQYIILRGYAEGSMHHMEKGPFIMWRGSLCIT